MGRKRKRDTSKRRRKPRPVEGSVMDELPTSESEEEPEFQPSTKRRKLLSGRPDQQMPSDLPLSDLLPLPAIPSPTPLFVENVDRMSDHLEVEEETTENKRTQSPTDPNLLIQSDASDDADKPIMPNADILLERGVPAFDQGLTTPLRLADMRARMTLIREALSGNGTARALFEQLCEALDDVERRYRNIVTELHVVVLEEEPTEVLKYMRNFQKRYMQMQGIWFGKPLLPSRSYIPRGVVGFLEYHCLAKAQNKILVSTAFPIACFDDLPMMRRPRDWYRLKKKYTIDTRKNMQRNGSDKPIEQGDWERLERVIGRYYDNQDTAEKNKIKLKQFNHFYTSALFEKKSTLLLQAITHWKRPYQALKMRNEGDDFVNPNVFDLELDMS